MPTTEQVASMLTTVCEALRNHGENLTTGLDRDLAMSVSNGPKSRRSVVAGALEADEDGLIAHPWGHSQVLSEEQRRSANLLSRIDDDIAAWASRLR